MSRLTVEVVVLPRLLVVVMTLPPRSPPASVLFVPEVPLVVPFVVALLLPVATAAPVVVV